MPVQPINKDRDKEIQTVNFDLVSYFNEANTNQQKYADYYKRCSKQFYFWQRNTCGNDAPADQNYKQI